MSDVQILKSEFKVNMDRAEGAFKLFQLQYTLVNDLAIDMELKYREAIKKYKQIIDVQTEELNKNEEKK